MVAVLSVVLVWFLGGGPDTPSLVVVGLIPYNFFAYCLQGCASSIVGNSSLVKKVAFPRQVLPAANILTHLVHFAIQSVLVVLVLLVFPPSAHILSFQLLWLVPVFVVHLGLCVGVGLLVAALNVVYRDTQYIIESLLTVLFWLSPVLYDAGAVFAQSPNVPAWAAHVYFLNPLSGVLESYRAILFHGVAPDRFVFGAATVLTLLIGALGVRAFWVHERQFADLIQ
jgi:ABC-type polysaccharide/polyol phosphate export permease